MGAASVVRCISDSCCPGVPVTITIDVGIITCYVCGWRGSVLVIVAGEAVGWVVTCADIN